MEWLTKFLSSGVWGGISGLLAIVALLMTLKQPAKWISSHKFTRWLSTIPWVGLVLVSGLAAAWAVASKFGDPYRGIAVGCITVLIGITIQWAQTRRTMHALQNEADRRKTNHKRLVKALQRIVQLQQGSQTDYRTNRRRIVHEIGAEGDGILHEEMTITPLTKPIYFHVVRYSYDDDNSAEPIQVSAASLSHNTKLTVLELEFTSTYGRYAILVDPPATVQTPHRIAIDCARKRIWRDLLTNGEDDAYFALSYPSDLLTVELIAPSGRKWKNFLPTVQDGTLTVDSSVNPSRVLWELPSPAIRRYDYKAVLD